jgi:RNA polymerase sigma-70 factor (ECF subfamily)
MWSFAHGGPPRRSGGFGASRRVEEAAVGVDEPAAPGPRSRAPVDFEALYREHDAAVARLCRRMLGTGPAAEDAAHEVFLRGQRGLDGYDPAHPFRPWILAIAGHHCIDQLRRRRTEWRLFDAADLDAADLADSAPSPLGEALRTERRAEVHAAIDALPLKLRLPLVLRYFNELDYDGIAELLHVTRNQVGTLLFRARRRLRDQLAGGAER